MFIDYLRHDRNTRDYRVNRERVIEGVWDLIRVLDEAENHWQLRNCDDLIRKYNAGE